MSDALLLTRTWTDEFGCGLQVLFIPFEGLGIYGEWLTFPSREMGC